MGNLIMPKNIGDGDYMVALKIYYEAGDWISNDEFKSRLKAEIGDGLYISTYTKIVQILSYYNFVEWQDITRDQSLRRITKSGRRFYIACENNDQDMIDEELIYALKNTLFGKFNSGAPGSDSDVEAPIVFIKAARALGSLSYSEFAYILWRMDNDNVDFEMAINEVKQHRNANTKISLDAGAAKYKDAKPIQTLVKWGFLEQEKADSNSKDDVNAEIIDSETDEEEE